MQENDILNLWRSYDKRLQAHLQLHNRNTADIIRMKVGSLIRCMTPVKVFTVLTGLLWVAFVDIIIVSTFHYASPFFIVSAVIQVLLTKVAIGVYLYQLVLIYQSDLGEPILATQLRLARLRASTLWVTRLLILQLPVWTTFYLSTKMFADSNYILLVMQVLITGLFTFAAGWLFFNINLSNKDKRWFRILFSGKEWQPVMRSLDLLEEVKAFKKDENI